LAPATAPPLVLHRVRPPIGSRGLPSHVAERTAACGAALRCPRCHGLLWRLVDISVRSEEQLYDVEAFEVAVAAWSPGQPRAFGDFAHAAPCTPRRKPEGAERGGGGLCYGSEFTVHVGPCPLPRSLWWWDSCASGYLAHPVVPIQSVCGPPRVYPAGVWHSAGPQEALVPQQPSGGALVPGGGPGASDVRVLVRGGVCLWRFREARLYSLPFWRSARFFVRTVAHAPDQNPGVHLDSRWHRSHHLAKDDGR